MFLIFNPFNTACHLRNDIPNAKNLLPFCRFLRRQLSYVHCDEKDESSMQRMKSSNFELDYIIYHVHSSLSLLQITFISSSISSTSVSSRILVQLSSLTSCSRRLFLLRDILNFQQKLIFSFLFQKISYFLHCYPFYKSDLINTRVSLLQHQVLISYDYLEVIVLDIYS